MAGRGRPKPLRRRVLEPDYSLAKENCLKHDFVQMVSQGVLPERACYALKVPYSKVKRWAELDFSFKAEWEMATKRHATSGRTLLQRMSEIHERFFDGTDSALDDLRQLQVDTPRWVRYEVSESGRRTIAEYSDPEDKMIPGPGWTVNPEFWEITKFINGQFRGMHLPKMTLSRVETDGHVPGAQAGTDMVRQQAQKAMDLVDQQDAAAKKQAEFLKMADEEGDEPRKPESD